MRRVVVSEHIRKTPTGTTLVDKHTRAIDGALPSAVTEEDKSNEYQMWLKWKLGGERPEDLRPLVSAMSRLVNKYASEFIGKIDIPPEAIRTEFNKQLIEALKRYDPAKGASLATFAVWYMHKAKRFVSSYQNAARIPEERVGQIRAYELAKQTYMDEYGAMPTDAQLAKKLGWEEKNVALLRTELRKDLTTSKFETDPSAVTLSYDNELIKMFLYELKSEEQEVYRYLAGLGKPRITSIEEIAKKLKQPQHKVYRIRTSIAKKFKSYQMGSGIEEEAAVEDYGD